MKLKAKIGDVIRMKYANSVHDKKPTIVYLTTMKANNGNRIVSGFNLNYLKSFKRQKLLIDYVNQFKNALEAYEFIKVNFPDAVKSYRSYSESLILHAYRVDTKTAKFIKI